MRSKGTKPHQKAPKDTKRHQKVPKGTKMVAKLTYHIHTQGLVSFPPLMSQQIRHSHVHSLGRHPARKVIRSVDNNWFLLLQGGHPLIVWQVLKSLPPQGRPRGMNGTQGYLGIVFITHYYFTKLLLFFLLSLTSESRTCLAQFIYTRQLFLLTSANGYTVQL